MRKNIEEKLLNCKNLKEFADMFLGLPYQEKLSIFNKDLTIPKGMMFYRIRRKDSFKNPNINDSKEWEPVPADIAPKGRFNREKESVIYVASSPDILERELNIKKNEKYYLAKYVCQKGFTVGTTLGNTGLVNTLIHKILMSVCDSGDFTESENQLIDTYFNSHGSIVPNTIWQDMLSPLYIHKLIPDLYDVTNKIGKLIISKYENGFRYSSAYHSPLEFSGGLQIFTLDGVEYGNFIFTHTGFSNIKFISAEEKICTSPTSLDVMIQTISEEQIK